jgi:hypothetical protein
VLAAGRSRSFSVVGAARADSLCGADALGHRIGVYERSAHGDIAGTSPCGKVVRYAGFFLAVLITVYAFWLLVFAAHMHERKRCRGGG